MALGKVFSEAQLKGRTWQQLARMAHDRHDAQTEKSRYSIVDLMLQTYGPAIRDGWKGTMRQWFEQLMDPPTDRSASRPIVEPTNPPTGESTDPELDQWLEEL